MIGWVSCSANGDSVPAEAVSQPWLLYPRHADRLTAIGWTGVYRCWKYNRTIKSPPFVDSTARCATEEEVWKVATPARYALYKGDSASMVDHFYDKLLHVGRFETDNQFLHDEARRRVEPLLEFVLKFGRTGTVDEADFERAKRLCDEECAFSE
jgi:hypothetical protein